MRFVRMAGRRARISIVGAVDSALVAVVLLMAGRDAAAAHTATVAWVTVSPQIGTRQTTFVIRFTSRVRLGRHRGFALQYILDAFERNRRRTVGCEAGFDDFIQRGSRGQHLAFRESPASETIGWCLGRYRGRISLVATYPCRLKPSELACNPRTNAVAGSVTWLVRRR